MGDIAGTVLEQAVALVSRHLAAGQAAERDNIRYCVEHIRAAQAAIRGLEGEVDAIVTETKVVARFAWDRRVALYERIDRYVRHDRLRPLLADAITAVRERLPRAERDAQGVFARAAKPQATLELAELVPKLDAYFRDLSGPLQLSPTNYYGPSGVGYHELLEIQDMLANAPSGDELERHRAVILDRAGALERKREVRDASLASGNAVVERLLVAFDVPRSA
jgi:hypothetical protein